MEEVAFAGEVHRDPRGRRGGNHFVVAHRTAGLNDGRDTRIEQDVEPVREREKRIARGDTSRDPVARSVDCQVAGVDAIHLAHSDADGRAILGEQNGV